MNDKAHILLFMHKLDAALTFDVVLVAYGGTALGLLDAKERSEDVDLLYECDAAQKGELFKLLMSIGKTTGIAWGENPPSDTFEVSLFNLPDWLKRAKPFGKFKHIQLMTMDVYDILLTKISRYSERDEVDFVSITQKQHISKSILYKRFLELHKKQEFDVRKEFTGKYERFAKEYGNLLKA